MQWYKVETFNKCIAYKVNDNSYIMFGPDLSKFKTFATLELLLKYSEDNGLFIVFK
jgi:hypothetical protein